MMNGKEKMLSPCESRTDSHGWSNANWTAGAARGNWCGGRPQVLFNLRTYQRLIPQLDGRSHILPPRSIHACPQRCCPAKANSSNCSLEKWAVTDVCLCAAVPALGFLTIRFLQVPLDLSIGNNNGNRSIVIYDPRWPSLKRQNWSFIRMTLIALVPLCKIRQQRQLGYI